MSNTTYSWYAALTKPSWAPPSWLFGPVWTVLYIIIAITFGLVFYKVFTGEIPLALVIPFILNLIFNFAFTPLQFGLKNNVFAAVDIGMVLITLVWSLTAIFPYVRLVVYANLPYLAWVTFATMLQFCITYLNKG
jgi:tryptophan-rich sensory protein